MANPASPGGPQNDKMSYDPTALAPGSWGYVDPNSADGQRLHAQWVAQQTQSATGDVASAVQGAIATANAAGGGSVPGLPPSPGTYTNGMTPVFSPNDTAITGAPTAGPSSTYGLNDVWSSVQNALSSNKAQNYATQAAQLGAAPQFAAAIGSGATGTAAQGTAAQAGPASFLAALGNAAQGSGSYMQAAQGGAAQMPGTAISTAGDAAWQARQQSLADTLAMQASGGGVSPADLQLKQGAENNLASQLAALGSQRGGMGNPALTARAAADAAAASGATLNSQMGVQRAAETLQAQQALGALAGQARGQSQNYNQAQAALTQGAQQSNLSAAQQTMLANLGNLQGANQFNAAQGQGMTLADMEAINAITGQNVGALNTANQGNAQLAQQATQNNLAAQNAMVSQNLTAQNQFGLNNVNNEQAMNLANLANQQQSNIANQAALTQYGLTQGQFNQATALANQQANITSSEDYYKQMMGLLGVQTGIAQNNQQAALADQQMRQNAALTQYGIDQATATNTQQANMNLTGAGISAGATLGAALIAASDQNLKGGIEGGNPMVQSFLEQYRAWESGNVTQDRGLQEFGSISGGRAQSGANMLGAGVSAAGSTFAAAIKALTAKNRADNIAASSTLGQGSGASAYQAGLAAGPPPPDDTSALATQNLQGLDFGQNAATAFAPPEVADDTSSDDNEKSAVMSGNRGLQAFLEQANAQQNAQNQQGAQNNAFMATSLPPSAQVDRQLPDANAGYGGNPSLPPWLAQAGIGNQGGYSLGGVYGGGVGNYGGYDPGAGVYGGGVNQGATYNSNSPDVISNGGWMNSGQYDANGMPTSGTVQLPNFMNSLTTNSSNDPFANYTVPPFQGTTVAPATPYGGPPTAAGSGTNSTGATSTASTLGTVQPISVGIGGPRTSMPSGLLSALQMAPQTPQQQAAVSSEGALLGTVQPNTPSGSSMVMPPLRAISDEEEKADAKPDYEQTKELLDHLTAYSYRYKDPDAPGAAPGRRLGVMAQDLEKSPLGSSFVRDTPNGKMVDYGQAAGTMMAALAYHNERLDDQDAKLRDLLERTTAARAA